MSKKICKEKKEITMKSQGKTPQYLCRKCGEYVIKEKWACIPQKIF